MDTVRKLSASLVGMSLCLAPVGAMADEPVYPSDWSEFYYNAGAAVHFYYSPASVTHVDGGFVLVEWTDSNLKGDEDLVFTAAIDCGKRLIMNLGVDRYDASTHRFVARVDLSEQDSPQEISPSTMSDYLSQRAC